MVTAGFYAILYFTLPRYFVVIQFILVYSNCTLSEYSVVSYVVK